ncbi:MAG: cytochrome c oxidase assembly factor Coa1 family protein [Pseudomonadota bacterium]|nr:cytochrome c oxidase assembly factor Coa1 family protein [Pseudomonadota bacterium]
MSNTSGQGAGTPLPEELRGWNWGAFFLNWVWGLFNGTPRALLSLIPLIGLIMPFVLGAKGNQWAWQHRRWESIEAFKKAQRLWAIAGAIIAGLALLAALFAALIMFSVFAAMKKSEPYQVTLAGLEQQPQIVAILGQPIQGGLPMGSINVSGNQGVAELSFNVHGPNGAGRIYLESHKRLGRWQTEHCEFEDAATADRLPCAE